MPRCSSRSSTKKEAKDAAYAIVNALHTHYGDPKNRYGLEEDVETVAVLAMLAVTDSLSEDLVYDITKAIYENTENMSHAKAEFIQVETALDGIGIDLHPGAEKYFTEAGVLE